VRYHRHTEWDSYTLEEKISAYQAGEDYLVRLSRYDISDRLQEIIKAQRLDSFLYEKLDIDYVPFTGKIQWQPTGIVDVHGRRKWTPNSWMTIRNRRRRHPVDVSFYSFDMIEYAYKKGYFSAEEYLETVRRKVAFENESN